MNTSSFNQLKLNFQSEKTLAIKWRLKQLNNFLFMLNKESDNICQALKNDLGKSSFESFSCEIAIVKNEIYTAIHHLDSWMKPKFTNNHLLI